MVTAEKVTVKIEFSGEKSEFEGEPETVFRQVEKFLLKTIPQISLARKLQASLDARDLAEIISPLVKITSKNEVLMTFPLDKASLSDRILTVLIGQRFLYVSGLVSHDELTLGELANKVLAGKKSISSRLSELNSRGFVDRRKERDQVRYKVTVYGILNFKNSRLQKILNKITPSE